jgi:hypothetical protein
MTAVEDLQIGSGDVQRTDPNEVRRVRPGFYASQGLTSKLQRLLVNDLDLHRQSKQAPWTVVGRDFRGIHRQLDDIAAVADADLEQQAWMLCSENVHRLTPLRASEPLP